MSPLPVGSGGSSPVPGAPSGAPAAARAEAPAPLGALSPRAPPVPFEPRDVETDLPDFLNQVAHKVRAGLPLELVELRRLHDVGAEAMELAFDPLRASMIRSVRVGVAYAGVRVPAGRIAAFHPDRGWGAGARCDLPLERFWDRSRVPEGPRRFFKSVVEARGRGALVGVLHWNGFWLDATQVVVVGHMCTTPMVLYVLRGEAVVSTVGLDCST